MPNTQMNIRLERSLKEGGDLSLGQAGCSPTQAVRALWGYAQRNAGNVEKVRRMLRMLEGEGDEEGESGAGEPMDASDAALAARAELYERLGIAMPKLVPLPFSHDGLTDALQLQVDADKAALEDIYAQRAAERGV